MALGHPIALLSRRRLLFSEIGCWGTAALFTAMVVVLGSGEGSIAGLTPFLVLGAIAGWQAWRLRGRRRRLGKLDWDALLPVIQRLRGMAFAEAVNTLQAEAVRGPEAPPAPQTEESAGGRQRAVVRLRPGLWVELRAKGALVTFAGASLGAGDAAPEATAPSLNLALTLSVLLVLFDGLMFGQGIVSLLIGLVLLVGRLPFILFSRQTRLRWPRLRNLACYLGAVVLVLAMVGANSSLAEKRAELLVTAVKAYHEKYHHFPGKLDELVPEYLREIPPAKIMLGDSRFSYVTIAGSPILYYTTLPPYGRRVYDFTTNRWTAHD